MSSLDTVTHDRLNKVYEWTAEYLRVLSETEWNAMEIMNIHDIFCRTVLQDEDVMKLFQSTGGLAWMLSDERSAFLYKDLIQTRTNLISIQTPHNNMIQTIQLVSTVCSLTKMLMEQWTSQTKHVVLEV